MPAQRIHIVPHEEGWALKREGHTKIESVYPTQKDAIDSGRTIARDDEVDLVVHRQDGTFRNVLTFTTDMNETTNGNGRRIAAHDIASVGCRVSWGAILAGAAIGLTLNGLLWLGGIALGVTLVDQVSGRALTIAGAAWMACSTLLSLFVGGFVVSRVTAGENRAEAAMYGAILWGFFVASTLFLAASGVSVGAEVANLRPGAGNAMQSPESLRQIGLTEEQIAKVRGGQNVASEVAQLSPTAAAWWGFGSAVLSLLAAVAGSWLGAGPDLVLRLRRMSRTTTITQAQPT